MATASLPAPEMKRLTTKSVKPRTVDFGNSSTSLAIWSWPLTRNEPYIEKNPVVDEPCSAFAVRLSKSRKGHVVPRSS